MVTNPETYVSNSWYESGLNTPTNNYSTSPDNTETAIRIRPNTSTGEKSFYRTLNLTSYNTFDDNGVKFDTDALSFDNGPNDENSTQQYTTSYFVKLMVIIRLGITSDLSHSLPISLFRSIFRQALLSKHLKLVNLESLH